MLGGNEETGSMLEETKEKLEQWQQTLKEILQWYLKSVGQFLFSRKPSKALFRREVSERTVGLV